MTGKPKESNAQKSENKVCFGHTHGGKRLYITRLGIKNIDAYPKRLKGVFGKRWQF